MDPLTIISAIMTAMGLVTSLTTTSKRRKREEAQVGVLQEQFGAVGGRTEDIEAFYDSLTEFAQQGTELEREDVSRDFFGKALGLGRERRGRARSSGMVQTSTSDIDLAEIIAGRDIKQSFAGIEQQRQGELLEIGKKRELELQGIEDMLFELETEILGRGGGIEGGFSIENLSDYFGGFDIGSGGGGGRKSLPSNVFSYLTGIGR